MRPTVLLFDVDGTLITTGGVGRKALERAFEACFGRADACRGFRLDGMTDRAIVRQGLTAIGVEATEERIDEALERYLVGLAELVAAAPEATYRLHAGMQRTLDTLVGRSGYAVGLGTGNIRRGAKVKLDRVRVYEHFGFGGFGCDHELRPNLIRRGAERGAEALGAPLSECRVVVIGDTPKDVAAAKAMGAECLAVATGSFKVPQLKEAGADWAVTNLGEDGALELLLGHIPGRS